MFLLLFGNYSHLDSCKNYWWAGPKKWGVNIQKTGRDVISKPMTYKDFFLSSASEIVNEAFLTMSSETWIHWEMEANMYCGLLTKKRKWTKHLNTAPKYKFYFGHFIRYLRSSQIICPIVNATTNTCSVFPSLSSLGFLTTTRFKVKIKISQSLKSSRPSTLAAAM